MSRSWMDARNMKIGLGTSSEKKRYYVGIFPILGGGSDPNPLVSTAGALIGLSV